MGRRYPALNGWRCPYVHPPAYGTLERISFVTNESPARFARSRTDHGLTTDSTEVRHAYLQIQSRANGRNETQRTSELGGFPADEPRGSAIPLGYESRRARMDDRALEAPSGGRSSEPAEAEHPARRFGTLVAALSSTVDPAAARTRSGTSRSIVPLDVPHSLVRPRREQHSLWAGTSMRPAPRFPGGT